MPRSIHLSVRLSVTCSYSKNGAFAACAYYRALREIPCWKSSPPISVVLLRVYDHRKWPKRPWPWKTYVVSISKTTTDRAMVTIKHDGKL